MSRYLRAGRKQEYAERLFKLFIADGNVPAARLLADIVTDAELEARLDDLETRLREVEGVKINLGSGLHESTSAEPS